MTDMSATTPAGLAPSDVTTDAFKARVRKRYRSEALFRAYGAIALGITAIFVISVVTDIVRRGLPAFWTHSLVLDVPVSADAVDPQGTKDPAVIRRADYFTMARDALRATVPGVEGRVPRRKLDGLLSSGAANDLRELLAADPSLIGTTVKTRFLLSDDSDLYLKGSETEIERFPARGIGTPSGATGEITILTSSNDFADDLVRVKRDLAERIEGLKVELRRAERGDAARAERIKAEIAELDARVNQPGVAETLDERLPSLLVAINGGVVKLSRIGNAEASGTVILPLKSTADAGAGAWEVLTYTVPESNRKLGDLEITFLERLKSEGRVEQHFNTIFFTAGDSREAELAGILGALMGSILMLSVTLALCLPIGVLAAVYLEEFAPKNWFTDIIEININNLAAVPSIVFGLLGLAVFLNFFGLPRSAPLVGGLVLALLVLPTIIIASRAALKAVPPSIKEAALGVGASKQQAVFHHVLPLAMPGIMTGTIIGMAHALGETAPLLMIGMLAFIVDVPTGWTSSATALPAQLFIWSDLPEAAFQAKTAAGIMVLLVLLFVMNGAAIWLRRRFERRW
ncbi:MAG: phosphate ABC transporter permease PstA [Hyphomicrobiaceae bacterium]|nr:phosphate ABC transporter permease PstA [Hyphomicrobiaceae bacterium]